MTGGEGVPVALPVAWPNRATSVLPDGELTQTRATTVDGSLGHASARTGRRGLAVVRESLSARDWAVLRGVAQHRYLSTRQIEGFYFHDHATALAGARVCRRVLRRLATSHVLDHLERRIGGVRAGSASFVWRVGPAGDRLLREAAETSRRRQREPGRLFADHCLAVAAAHLALVQAHRAGELELVGVQTEPDCWRPFTGLGGARQILQPDLYIETGDPSDPGFINCWFVEVDRGTENPARLLGKCTRYERYRWGGQASEADSFPLVIWVMSDQRQAERLMAAIQRDTRLDPRLYRVTTAEQLVSLICGGVA